MKIAVVMDKQKVFNIYSRLEETLHTYIKSSFAACCIDMDIYYSIFCEVWKIWTYNIFVSVF